MGFLKICVRKGRKNFNLKKKLTEPIFNYPDELLLVSVPNVESIPMTTLDEVEYQPKNGPHKNPATSNKICCYGGNIRHLRLAMAIIITLIIIIISLIALLFFNVLNQKSQSSKDFVSKNDSAIYGQDYDYFDYDYSTSSLSYSSPRSPNSGFYRNPGIVYRINPLQFYDSDKDGHGDLNGIRLFIPYFVYIKVHFLNSFFLDLKS